MGGSDSGDRSSSFHRRSRSVSGFSHRIPTEEADAEEPSANRRGKFVNTIRGSGVPEISLDDLAIELFSSSDFGERGRASEVKDTAASRRRGRSVSKHGSRASELRNSSVDRHGVSDASSRRRRSLSVVRREIRDSENEHFQKTRSRVNPTEQNVGSKQKISAQKPTASSQQRGLRRCSSQKDFLRPTDGYSSYSSTLTDDEGNEGCYSGIRMEKAMQATHEKNKVKAIAGFVSDHGLTSADADVLKAVSTIRKNYKTKLEQSEKRKQELLAEIMLEEERGKELKKVVGELLPNPTGTSAVRRPMRGRKRSNDRNRMSKQLAEEAEKIIENFISSVEETDLSSFDGERSDTSSVFGGAIKPMTHFADEAFKSPLRYDLLPEEMDGVVLPWLKWETANDGTPILSNDNKQQPATPKTVLHDAPEDSTTAPDQERSVNSQSSRGSWSPGVVNSFSVDTGESSRVGEVESRQSQLLSLVPRRPRVDIHDYMKHPSIEEFVSERWRQRENINSGGLLICSGSCLGKLCL